LSMSITKLYICFRKPLALLVVLFSLNSSPIDELGDDAF